MSIIILFAFDTFLPHGEVRIKAGQRLTIYIVDKGDDSDIIFFYKLRRNIGGRINYNLKHRIILHFLYNADEYRDKYRYL